MKKEFIPYEQALTLKELGFDEPCFGFYYPNGKFIQIHTIGFPDDKKDCILTPLYQQTFRWFREKYNLCGWTQESYFKGLKLHQYYISKDQPLNIISNLSECTYEEAELECLKKLIEIVKDGK